MVDPPRQFDFLINNEFLRGSVLQHLQAHGASIEEVVTIEYVEATPKPVPRHALQHDDWIAAVDCSLAGLYVTGSYDGVARVWRAPEPPEQQVTQCLLPVYTHRGPIRAVAACEVRPGQFWVVSGSKDSSIVVCDCQVEEGSKQATCHTTVTCTGHTAAVEAVAVQAGGLFCSGSWDHSIRLWKRDNATQPIQRTEEEGDDGEGSGVPTKRRKLSGNSAQLVRHSQTKLMND